MKKKLSFYLEKVFGLSNKMKQWYFDETTSQTVFSAVATTNSYNEQDDFYLQEVQQKIIPNVHF